MKISKVIIENQKILDKHNIRSSEIKEILLNNHYILNVRKKDNF